MSAKEENKKKEKQGVFEPRIEKVTVNIGVGEAGERLRKAQSVLESITNQKPVQTLSKTKNQELGIREGMPIGCKVTLRGEKAHKFLKKALDCRDKKIADYSFDDQGNLSFGIPDHTLFEDQKYDPDVGIFGMDVCVTMEKPGYRIKRRRQQKKKIPASNQLSWEETMDFFVEKFDVKVI